MCIRTSLVRRAALAAVILLLQACAGSPREAADTLRQTAHGPVHGADDSATNGTLSWKGVPFARPPVGALRWRAPAEPEPWVEVRQTTRFASACKQTGRLYGPGANNRYDETIGSTLGQPLGDEDCLYLNIWQPAKPAQRPRPVIVWVYGGSNITGHTADPVYDGANLARSADAVVVSVNYRLGIFGFLNLAPLKTGNKLDDSGNFALLDIARALEFVQANIAAFGGDPGRVTLMGQSAGAVNVYALLTSPMVVSRSQPLFHRLVALSGGISTAATLPPGALPVVPAPAVLVARGNALLEASLVADGSAADEQAARAAVAARSPQQLAEYLRAKPANTLLETVRTRLAPRGLAAASVIPDGWVVATDPIAAIRNGRYLKVPVLAGTTRDEVKLFPALFAIRPDLGGSSGRLLDDAKVFALAHRYRPEEPPTTKIEDWVPPQYRPLDAPKTGFNARSDRLNDLWFLALRDDVLNALKSQQPEVWCYQFDWHSLPKPFDEIYGAAHTFDLPFLFGNFGPSLYANISFTRGNEPGRLALSRAMMDSLGAFAHRADPNHVGLGARWQPWPARLVFDASAEAARIAPR
ncbi:MAG: carboxylesterase/lipase family protein [Rhizobacter sp.]|nr:carboxylesterase/lipase family protein [Rhizobacter sp.]